MNVHRFTCKIIVIAHVGHGVRALPSAAHMLVGMRELVNVSANAGTPEQTP